MKANVNKLIEQVIYDNSEYVKDYSSRAEYLLETTKGEEFGWFFFLTDEEIAEFESSSEKAAEFIAEITEYINSYYNIEARIYKNDTQYNQFNSRFFRLVDSFAAIDEEGTKVQIVDKNATDENGILVYEYEGMYFNYEI